MNLYLINKLVQDILDKHLDYDTGEITEEGAKQIEALGIKKEEVILEMIKVYKNFQMLIDGTEAEINRLQQRVENYKRSQNSVMKQVRPFLIEGEKIITPEFELKWTTSTFVDGLDIYDPALEYSNKESLLKKFVNKKVAEPTYQFDKKAISDQLKSDPKQLPIDVFINQKKNPKIK